MDLEDDLRALRSDLVGRSFPVRIQVEGRVRRDWVVRTQSSLPPQGELDSLQLALEEHTFAIIKAAYAEAVPLERITGARPSYRLVRLDDVHLVVRAEVAGRETNVGDADLIAEWGVLQAVDERFRLEDVQGLPCEYWFPLREARRNR
jgi:hypothetical protein